jgi:hypothetical protein
MAMTRERMNTGEQADTPNGRTISITAVVDCVASLASGTVGGNVYLFDTNASGGSQGQGSQALHTRVARGDRLVWTVFGLECEAYVGITGISIDEAVCEPRRGFYPGTDIAYWTGTVSGDAAGTSPYQLAFAVGTRTDIMLAPVSAALVVDEWPGGHDAR